MRDAESNEARILLVDNDPIVFYLIRELLESENYLTGHATRGEDALELAATQKIDLILLDIMMPGMNGFEVCTRLQENPATAHIPIIFLSAKDDEESYIKGFELGAIDYLTKPINQLDLTLKIRNYLKLSRNELKLKESELRYKSIVEDQTEFILRVLPDGKITYANIAFCNFIEKSFDEIIGLNISDLIKTENKTGIMDQLESIKPTTLVQTNTRRIIFPDGRVTWQQWIDRGIFNALNKISEYQIVGRDVTIQKQYEEAIHVLTDATAGVTGNDFFNVLIINLVKLLNVDYAVIGEFSNTGNTDIKTVTACKKGSIIDNFTFSLSPIDSDNLISVGFLLKNNKQNGIRNDDGIVILGDLLPSYAAIPLLNSDKEIIGVLAVLSHERFKLNSTTIDIIKLFSVRAAAEYERAIAEKKIIESETRYRMLADYNYDWEYWIGPEGNFLYVSPSCERITGYTAEEFTADPNLMVEITHPDHKEMVESHFGKRTVPRVEFEVLEYMIVDRYGEEKWINHVCNPVYDQNKVFHGIRGNNRDITSRKMMENAVIESEKKFRNIFQNSIDGMLISDKNYRLLESNLAFQKFAGLSEDNLNQLFITSFIHVNDLDTFKHWFQNVIVSDSLNRPAEIRFFDFHREAKFMEINSKIINYQGKEAVLSILRDVTDRKELHFKIMNTIIETEDKERRRFAQDLHDGMGPLLSTIKLYTRSILTAKDHANKEIAIEKSLETIDDAITQIKEIAFNISPSILKDFGLVVAVKSYVNKFNDTKKVNINFQSQVNQRFSSNVEASLFRIITELVNNTVKHAHANNAVIDIRLADGNLLVNYSDDGIGFEMNSVFEKSKGQGLFNIINRTKSIGGEITIDTGINEGFNASISIPADK